jgi:hypothetical protein
MAEPEESLEPEHEDAKAEEPELADIQAEPVPVEDVPESSPTASDDEPQADDLKTPEVIQAVAPKTVSKRAPEEEPSSKKRKKRASSWETLASMFGVHITAAEPEDTEAEDTKPEPDVVAGKTSSEIKSLPHQLDQQPDLDTGREVSAEAEQRDTEKRSRRRKISIFDEPEDDTNPALDAMFGDAPRRSEDSWKAERRVVDDIGWDDEVENPKPRDVGDDLPDSQVVPPVKDDVFAEEAVDDSADEGRQADRPARGRRRRRGGRDRDREQRDVPRSRGTDEGIKSEAWPKDPDDEPLAWAEPDSFEGEEDSELGEVERRSNRRRRRGRPRSEDTEGVRGPAEERDSTGFAGRPEGEVRGDRRPATRGRPERGPRDRDAETERDRDADRPERSGRGGRRRRSEEARGDDVRPNRAEESIKDRSSPDDTSVEAFDESDDGGSLEPQHRNIPTWTEALQSIIETNAENHRKNENRGGPRGRPRGRR